MIGSLTGGGGLSNSSSAAAGTGDQSQSGPFQGGSINFGAGSTAKGLNTTTLMVAAVVLAGLWVISKRKK